MAEAKKSTKTTKLSEKKELKEAQLMVEAAPAIPVNKKGDKPAAPAKAGKRSPKAIAETEAKQVKEAKKSATVSEKPKQASKPPRSKAERAGKKYREATKLIEKDKLYSLTEALTLATKTSTTKFDASVELHVNLGVDPRQADQNIRDSVSLPAGTGKQLRVAAFVEGDDIEKAKKAGADITGADEITAQLDKEEIAFDTLVATPALMARLGKYARLLGPKGLMPNPKSGTVTADISKAVSEAKGGKVEYRVDPVGIIHLAIGKVSFGPEKLLANAEAVMSSIRAAKPASLKGFYIKRITITTTMGPGIGVETNARS